MRRRIAVLGGGPWADRDVEVEKASGGLMVRSAPAQHTYCLRYGPLYVPRTDRYTFVIKLIRPIYTFIYNMADCRVSCAVARSSFGRSVQGANRDPTSPLRRSSRLIVRAADKFPTLNRILNH